MTVDENFATVILINPRKMSVDKNHTWDKMRFFKICQFSVTYKKKSLKNDPINVTCYWATPQSFTDRSLKRCQTRLENDPVTWVNEPLFLGEISVI